MFLNKMTKNGVEMKKLLSYLLLMSLFVIFVSACSKSDSTIDDTSDPEAYLTNQLRADAGSNKLTLEWKELPAAETYNIYYMEDDGSLEVPSSAKMKSHGIKIDGVTEDIISAPYTVTGLKNGQTYWLALSAKTAGQDESDLTKALHATPKDNPPLPAPENVRANAGDGEVTVTWDTVTNASGYKAYYFTSFTITGESPKITSNSHTFTGLKNGQSYIFWVEAKDGDDNSTSGDSSASFIYPATPSNSPPPSAPINPALIDNHSGNIIIEWDTISGATSYNVYIAKAKGVTKLTGDVTNIKNPDITPKQGVTTTLTNGKYYIVVTAVNANGESAESREVSIEITDNP
jgi:hypothetical protein